MEIEKIRLVSGLILSFVVAYFVRSLAQLSVPLRPTVGYSGQQRDRSFAPGSISERALRTGGAWMFHLCAWLREKNSKLASFVERVEKGQLKHLVWAGVPLGLSVHETFFCTILTAFIGAAGGLYAQRVSGSAMWILPCIGVGACLVQIRLRSVAAERLLQISHQFPAVIDLTALAMNAGSDLPSALTKIAGRQTGAVADELRQFLLALDLGMTRRSALLALEERCPVDEVRDLVRAILMAELKGASVAEALGQQAQTSRQRRSVRAEEAAARAGVMILFPMMLLMGSLLILLVAPMVMVIQF